LTPEQIGLLLAATVGMPVVATPAVGILADRLEATGLALVVLRAAAALLALAGG
jgi:hypothetical protein